MLIIAGFVFLLTPGPSYIIIVIGLWMLAGEFLLLARLFDRLEARLVGVGRRIKSLWRRAPASGKTLAVLTILGCVAALAYALFA